MENQAFAGILLLCILLIGLLIFRSSLMAARGGKILAFIAFFLLPVGATVFGTNIHLQNSKSTHFCLSCHTMDPYGKSLYVDDSAHVPANHFQNRRIPRDQACFACHTEYTMYGDLRDKIRGLRHLYVYYLKETPQKIALYEPYKNRECLHCHAGARSYAESSPHKEMQSQLFSNQLSCLTCHNKIHSVQELDNMQMWREPGK